MNYKEWDNLIVSQDKLFPFCRCYFYSDGSCFYIEPMFYTQLNRLEEIYPDKYNQIIDKMESIVHKNKKVIFTHDFESPYVNYDDFIYVEIEDITNHLHIYVEDKSRGSDYGD